MAMLVGLNEAKAQLRQDSNDDDGYITMLIHAASGMVLNYLKRDLNDLTSDDLIDYDSEGVIIMEEETRMATLYLIGMLYRDRDGQMSDKWQQGYLPYPVTAMLYPLRDPALK